MHRRTRLLWVWIAFCLSPVVAGAEEPPEAKEDPARSHYDAHRRAADGGDLPGARTALASLRAVTAGTPADDDERKQWLQALYRAHGSAQRYLPEEAALHQELLADITRHVEAATDSAAWVHFLAEAHGSVHTELGEVEAYARARAALERLRVLQREHPKNAQIAEELSRVLFNEHIHLARAGQSIDGPALLAETKQLTLVPGATVDTHENHLWLVFRELDEAYRRGDASRGRALLESAQAHVRARPQLPPSHALAATLVRTHYHVAEDVPPAEVARLLDLTRRMASAPQAAEDLRDEFATMLANAVYVRHVARSGQGIPDLLGELRTLAQRAGATDHQRAAWLRGLRNGALHHASQRRFEKARALRGEAEQALAGESATDEMRRQYAWLCADVLRQLVAAEAAAEVRAWESGLTTWFRGGTPTEGIEEAYAAALVEVHVLLEEAGDEAGTTRMLAQLAELVRDGGSQPVLLAQQARAFDNRHFFLLQRGDVAGAEAQLQDLRALAVRAPDEPGIALDLAQSLDRMHERLMNERAFTRAAALRTELLRRATEGANPEGERFELFTTLALAHAKLGDAKQFEAADLVLTELVRLGEEEQTSARQLDRLVAALRDQIWDVVHAQRDADVPAVVARAIRAQARLTKLDPNEDQLGRVLVEAVTWADEVKDVSRGAEWRVLLGLRAAAPQASAMTRGAQARRLELDVYGLGDRHAFPAAFLLLDQLTQLAVDPRSTRYIRRRLAMATAQLHLECCRGGQFDEAAALYVALDRLDRSHAPRERHTDLLAHVVHNGHWFADDRGDRVEGEAWLRESVALAAADDANADVLSWHADTLVTVLRRQLADDEVDAAAASLQELRDLARRKRADERVRTQLGYALYEMHYLRSEAGELAAAGRLREEFAGLARRDQATEALRGAYGGAVADAVWDEAVREDWKTVDRLLQTLRDLVARGKPTAHLQTQWARALRAVHEHVGLDGRKAEAAAAFASLEQLAAEPAQPEAARDHVAWALTVESARREQVAPGAGFALVPALEALCAAQPERTQRQDALARLLQNVGEVALAREPRGPEDVRIGRACLERLESLGEGDQATAAQHAALDAVLAGGLDALVREADADAWVTRALRRLRAAAAREDATKEMRARLGRGLRQYGIGLLAIDDVEGVVANLRTLDQLTQGGEVPEVYLMFFAMAVSDAGQALRDTEDAEQLQPFVERLEALVKSASSGVDMMLQLYLDQARGK